MWHHLKSLSKQTIVYGGGLLLKRGIGFFMIPVYTRYMNPEEYGLLEILELTGFIAAFFIGFGMLQAVYRFHSDVEGADAQRRVKANAIMTVVVMGGAVTAGLLAASPWIARISGGKTELAPLVVLLVLGVFANEIGQLLLGFFRVEARPVAYVVYSLSSTAVSLTLNVVFLVGLAMGVRGILLSTLISAVLLVVVLMAGFVRAGGFRADFALIRQMFVYCLPFIPTGLMAFTVNFSDRYFLRVFTDMGTVGIYALGYKLGMIGGFLVGTPFGLVWKAQAFEIAKEPNAQATYARVMTYYSGALLAVCAVLSISAREIVALMAAPEYARAAAIVPIVAWATVFLTLDPMVQVGILLKKRTVWLPVIYAGTMAINIGLNFLLIPRMGMMGAAWATVAALFFQVAAGCFVAYRLYPIRYEWRRLMAMVAGVLVAQALAGIVPQRAIAGSLALKGVLLAVLAAALLALPGFLLKDERTLLSKLLGRVVRRGEGAPP
ncbi:MAG: oligosaccharide flippase family protein [Acidobacteriia bacterium]|nr:oligosaccharide flippase family protein [Terriglobia bacterium]